MKVHFNWSGVTIEAENDLDKEVLDNLWFSLGYNLNHLEPDDYVQFNRKEGKFEVCTS